MSGPPSLSITLPNHVLRERLRNGGSSFADLRPMISLGQSNTIVSYPALTTHSELTEGEFVRADIRPTTIGFAVGDEDPKDLIVHLVHTARFAIDPQVPGLSAAFPKAAEVDALVRECDLDTHRCYIDAKPSLT